jgi:hypothetical protein
MASNGSENERPLGSDRSKRPLVQAVGSAGSTSAITAPVTVASSNTARNSSAWTIQASRTRAVGRVRTRWRPSLSSDQ